MAMQESKTEPRVQSNWPPHLSEPESCLLDAQISNSSTTKATYLGLFRYATCKDVAVISISALCSIVGGATLPVMNLVIASIAGNFSKYYQGQTSNFASEMARLTLYLLYLAIGQFFTISASILGFTYTGEKITGQIRYHYLASLLRQNIAYFDNNGAGEVTTRITSDTNMVQEGISEKLGMSLKELSTFVAAYVVGFVIDWRLTLVLTSTVIAISGILGGLSQFVVKWSKKSLACYAEGGSLAEETMGPNSIRNVLAFSLQDTLGRQYEGHLKMAEKFGFRMRSAIAAMAGFLMFCIYSTYALAFWLGSRYLVSGQSTLPHILTVLLSIMSGAFALGHAGPNLQAFTTATAAAAKIYSTIDRQSPMDPASIDGLNICPHALRGAIEFRGVKHVYPARPDVTVLHDLNLMFPPGKTTAIVGSSGSGKSTIIALLQRFYNPVGGQVLLDGLDLREFNIRWLRQQFGLVSQEPVLFDTSVAENIRFGLIGYGFTDSELEPVISDAEAMELIEQAAKMCNADEFIRRLPNGYRTNISGALLSGGQRQRIAIARAIVANPKILLLDEATSALDNKSEKAVQAALENAARGRSTVIVAHRLSTIRGAHNIVVMDGGRVVEQGTHENLLRQQGVYHSLVRAQLQEGSEVHQEPESLDILQEAKGDYSVKESPSRFSSDFDPESKAPPTCGSAPSEQPSLWSVMKFVASLNQPERRVMLLGLVSSIFCGAGNPMQAIFFAKCIAALSLSADRFGELRSQVDFWTGMFLMLALVELCFHLLAGISFAWCSEKLVLRARMQSFRSMLGQDMAYFEEHSVGSLTSFLSTETTHLAGISGVTLGTILNAASTLAIGCIIAVAIGWKLALVCVATTPIVLGCGYLRFSILSRLHSSAMAAQSVSASYACEAISAIRTVASLTLEAEITRRYHEQLVEQARKIRSIVWTSALFGASEGLMTLCVALGFWYGGKLIGEGEYSVFQFFAAFMAVVYGSEAAGTVFSFAPDMAKSRGAAVEVQKLLKRKAPIESSAGEPVHDVQGQIEFRNVHFRYPTRDELVLKGLDLNIQPGQYVALVGHSGCGKSTTISMLERFYDPLIGQVLLDGKDISTLDVKTYRSHFALVSQEPRLYKGTIRDNIVLGSDESQCKEEDIIRVCRDANIYDFIVSLPSGFDTDVGSKAIMLSGGQKQRIAIARALLRNPRILLLDEATSAIDSVSEQAVQAALDNASKGRTTVAIAHRLSTIQKADVIYLLDRGRVAECGSHADLMAKRDKYFELVQSHAQQQVP
ncbi:ABC transporter, ABC-B family, MDR type [Lecanosticta acicola]|uniref:ABC transporter, ABC-B family, MDR type n=1 Tax=Lecanosticta acicola TaxID=111012 RepID=A0AAI9ED90_9PEZI|nr:ABC transporter, ABC-B family, MDR type [Lecanosticta acicola]